MILFGAFFASDGSMSGQHLSAIPKRSKFEHGDWVQLHGYTGGLPGQERFGFRGFVLGGFGAGLLRGLTDDGREWVFPAGWLVPDGQRENGGASCVCCPHPERFRPRRVKREPVARTFGPVPECLRPYLPAAPVESVQLDLFEVAA